MAPPAALSMVFGVWGALGAPCFAARTPLLTLEGSAFIEDIQVGDYVLARDEFDPDGPVLAKQVEEVFRSCAPIWHVHVGGQVIRTTAEHPFWVRGKGWMATVELRVGDELSSHDGQWVKVEDLLDTGEWEPVYNLRVAQFHTYFVGAVSWGFSSWAHNACKKAVRLPAENKLSIDWEHIAQRHMPGGIYAEGRTVFQNMTEAQVQNAIRRAYRNSKLLESQTVLSTAEKRVRLRGTANELTIEMWVNVTLKRIETAYPIF